MHIANRLFILYIQLYDCHKKHLSSDKEVKRWQKIDYRYMTEESDVDEEVVA